MDEAKLLEHLRGILCNVDQLLVLAESELWDDFQTIFADYEKLTANMLPIAWSLYAVDVRDEIKDLLIEIESKHQRLLPLAISWKAELKAILNSEVQSRRLDEKYR
ncbi:flagellar protein FliT [Chitinibacter sp. GC72]|uniref:flagellar protein FliT n=1 Tax=Chitinibacter sp. GC72 TaxID=1526917 RepID=UPI0012FA47A8|nr:flagellar protein FliT [Chitinibacter sp. GC72]